jgi:hypothetical protein
MYAVSGVNCAGAPSGAGGRGPRSTSLCAMSRVAAGSGVTVAVTAAVLAARSSCRLERAAQGRG